MKKSILFSASLLLAAAAFADTMTLGYAGGEFVSGAPIGAGHGEGEWVDAAIFIPQSTVEALAGNKITGVNGCLNSLGDVETVRGWVRKELDGENLAEFTLVPTQLNKVKKGVNKLVFEHPVELTADFGSGLYIGFGHKILSGNARGLSGNTTPIPGAFFLKRPGQEWMDASNRGSACIDAVIEGDNLPAVNPRLSKTEGFEYLIKTRGKYERTFVIHNFGTKALNGLKIKASAGGAEDVFEYPGKIAPNGFATVTASFKLDADVAGTTPVEFSIMPNEGVDADPADNVMTENIFFAAKEYTRRVLSEEFTTEMCANCPPVTKMIHDLLALPEFANVLQVCHHAGYKTDFLTEPWHETFTGLYGGGTFAPGICADRSEISYANIVFFPDDDKEFVSELWNKRLDTPAVVDVNISAYYEDDNHKKLKVTVSGEKSVDKFCENPVINVMLIENGIPHKNQGGAGKEYFHDYVSRAVSGKDSHWGDPIVFDGDNYTYTCTFDIKSSWKPENMQIIAYISDNSSWRLKEVANANRIEFSEIGMDAVSEVGADNSTVVSEEYYDLTGRRISAPASVCIRRAIMSDGKVNVSKVFIR